jgi:dihydrodipicolinate synthase/N-acetylneuraminate lyase
MNLVKGLSVPLLTALDEQGRLDAASQQRLCAWAWQQGRGADIFFPSGTTGEWNRLSPETLRQVNEACLKALAALGPSQEGEQPALWAGVTSPRLNDSLANIGHALQIGAQAAVLAPLSITDSQDPVALFRDHITPLFERVGRTLPICLYDNADIAVSQERSHLRTADLKQLSRLDYVLGVKVSAGAKVVGNYLKGARHFKRAHEFGLYLGNVNLAFSLFKPAHGLAGALREAWFRFWLRGELPVGVVSGPANLFPREWKRAWRACLAGEEGLMARYQACFESLSSAWRFEHQGKKASKSLACMKAALESEGLLASAAVASGTPALEPHERDAFLARYREIKQELASFAPQGWTSNKEGCA